ncbi:hypothetical protein [Zhihengliuella halotolerans]|uniref:hypothetical protein n=1 Tax=Zhihengliuella halotolerans TaxID=370736 RepID=UPI000C8031DB|nr:hypothetical protein [Zhihengliuella halotolerans]
MMSMDLAWCPGIIGDVTGLVEYQVRTGAECDEIRDLVEETMIELAEPLAQACADSGISLPEEDSQMLAVLGRDAARAPLAPRYGVVMSLPGGRLAVGVGHGRVIESAGDGLCLIDQPEPGRYLDAWFLPSVFYWEDL